MWCERSGYSAEVNVSNAGQKVEGAVYRSGEQLYGVRGKVSRVELVTPGSKKRAERVEMLYEASPHLEEGVYFEPLRVTDGIKTCDSVWGEVKHCMKEKDWRGANVAKRRVEASERRQRRHRQLSGHAYTPHFFVENAQKEWVPNPHTLAVTEYRRG